MDQSMTGAGRIILSALLLAVLGVFAAGCGNGAITVTTAGPTITGGAATVTTAGPTTTTAEPEKTGSSAPELSHDAIQQVIDAAPSALPGGKVARISLGLKDNATVVDLADTANVLHKFYLVDGALVPDGVREDPGSGVYFTLDELSSLVPLLDSIAADAAAFAQSNMLLLDKRTFIKPAFKPVPGSDVAFDQPVVEYWLGDVTETLDSGNYPLRYRIYSATTGNLLWQASSDDTDMVFQVYTQ